MRRLIRQGKATEETPIYTFETADGKKAELTGKIALALLRDYIESIDYKSLGLVLEDIGLHSLRAAAAMAMFLNGVPTPLIMLIGRWSSEAFLLYIRKAVEQFGHDVSKIMIRNPTYHHVLVQEKDDPRLSADSLNHNMASMSRSPLTAFEIWKKY